MKRHTVLEHLHAHQCFLFREGKKHSVYHNREIDDFLVDKICKDLGIPKIK